MAPGSDTPEEQVKVADLDKAGLKAARLAGMISTTRQAVQTELEKASELVKLIKESKTTLKKQYYTKKLLKVRGSLMELMATAEYLEKVKGPDPKIATGETKDPNYKIVEPTITRTIDETPITNLTTDPDQSTNQ